MSAWFTAIDAACAIISVVPGKRAGNYSSVIFCFVTIAAVMTLLLVSSELLSSVLSPMPVFESLPVASQVSPGAAASIDISNVASVATSTPVSLQVLPPVRQ